MKTSNATYAISSFGPKGLKLLRFSAAMEPCPLMTLEIRALKGNKKPYFFDEDSCCSILGRYHLLMSFEDEELEGSPVAILRGTVEAYELPSPQPYKPMNRGPSFILILRTLSGDRYKVTIPESPPDFIHMGGSFELSLLRIKA